MWGEGVKFVLRVRLPQRTCYIHGAQDHDPSGRLHVRGQKEEEARPETVKENLQVCLLDVSQAVRPKQQVGGLDSQQEEKEAEG